MSGGDFDAARFKANERAGFNRIAARYAAAAPLRASLQQALVELAAIVAGERVLDLASGPCLLAGEAAAAVGAHGRVVASDLAEGMLHTGRDAATPALRERMLFAAADAEHLPFADGAFDLVMMGLGLFILPAPARALAEMRRVLRPGGRLALSVWGPREAVPLIRHAQDCITRLLPAPRVPRPSVFRFGEAQALGAVLAEAGFAEARFAEHALTARFDSAADYWQAFLDLAGGAAESISRLPPALQARLAAEVASELEPCRSDGAYGCDSRVLLACARR